MAVSGIATIKTGQGGFAFLPAWRADIGVCPIKATMSVPGLGIIAVPASIDRNGFVRARVPASKAGEEFTGVWDVTWTLTVPVVGIETFEAVEPEVEEFEVTSELEITAEAAKLRQDRTWTDARGLPTPDYLREKMLFGIPFIDQDQRLMGDEAVERAIAAAAQRVENECGIVLGPRYFSGIPGAVSPDELPVVVEAGYDYDPYKISRNYSMLRLRNHPVIRLDALELWLGNTKMVTIPPSFFTLHPAMGDVQLVANAIHSLGINGLAFPLLSGRPAGQNVPHLWRASYLAGKEVDASLYEVVTWIAAQSLLMTISDSITAGLASLSTSIDGISESVATTNSSTNSTYGAFIGELEKRIKAWFKDQAPGYHGIVMGS